MCCDFKFDTEPENIKMSLIGQQGHEPVVRVHNSHNFLLVVTGL